jgi:hypothetical protein
MANVLVFPTPLAQSSSDATGNSLRAVAEIILFPGIRYERMTEADPAPAPERTSSNKPAKRGRKKG